MDVDHTPLRDVQKSLLENLTESHDHDEVRVLFPDPAAKNFVGSLFRLKHFNPMIESKLLHGRRSEFFPPPLWSVRLGDDGQDVVAMGDQRLQGRDGKIRGTHEN